MSADRRDFRVIAFAITALTIGVYARVGEFGFSEFDDTSYVVNCPLVQSGLTWNGVREAFSTFRTGNWHPLTWLSLMTDRQLFGTGPRAFHFTNLALHVANSLLLLVALRQLTGNVWRSGIVAVLFALHPLHVESVAWVSERKDVLSTLFWMLALWSYSHYARRSSLRWFALVIVSFALGLLAKPMLVTLPCVLLLLDYWPLARLSPTEHETVRIEPAETPPNRRARKATKASHANSLSHPVTSWRTLVLEKLPLFVLAAASCAATVYAQRYTIAPLASRSLSGRLANAVTAYVAYLGQMLWPTNLACFYPYQRHDWTSGWPIAASLLLVGITVVSVKARQFPWLLVGWLWYLGTLVPVIGLVQVGGQARADRYTYVPLIGIFVMAAWSIPARWWELHRGKVAIVAACTISCLMFLSWRQVGYWHDDQMLFEHAVEVTRENSVAQLNLGYIRHKQGKLTEAERYYKEAIRIAPKSAMAHALLSEVSHRRGNSAAALEHARAAVESNPNIPESQSALGMAYVAHGKLADAITHFRLAVRLSPDQPEYQHFLGLALSDSGDLDEAAAAFRAAIRLRPNLAHAHNELGTVLARQGQLRQAIDEYQKALQFNPGLVSAQNNLRNARERLDK